MALLLEPEEVVAEGKEDLDRVRRVVRRFALAMGFGVLDQTRIATAASELARNMIVYARGGSVRVEAIQRDGIAGLQLTFDDRGPGIADPAGAFVDGFSSGQGLGLGLGGASRLMDELELATGLGQGTRITVVKWVLRRGRTNGEAEEGRVTIRPLEDR